MKTHLKLSAEFSCFPIWIKNPSDDFHIPIDPNELPISAQLKARIQLWDQQYQSIYNEEYPPDSQFKSLSEEKEFFKLGNEIKAALEYELGNKYEVIF